LHPSPLEEQNRAVMLRGGKPRLVPSLICSSDGIK
jgi:hypothetical protein